MKTKKRRGPGRPPDGETAKSEVIRLRVTPTAKRHYETIAVRRGVTLSELIETLLRDAAIADRII